MCAHESKYALDYFFYPLSYDLKFKLNIQDLIHVNASQHTWSKCLTSHKLVETLIVRKCFILKIAAMNQICTGYMIYLIKIIGKLINKTKCATFPYHTFFLDVLYLKPKCCGCPTHYSMTSPCFLSPSILFIFFITFLMVFLIYFYDKESIQNL